MNTNITHQFSKSSNPVEPTPTATNHKPRIRHRIVAFLAATILLATGLGAASATPAAVWLSLIRG